MCLTWTKIIAQTYKAHYTEFVKELSLIAINTVMDTKYEYMSLLIISGNLM